MLCKTCTDLFLAIREDVDILRMELKECSFPDDKEREFEHHASYDAYKEAVSIGCRLCKKMQLHRIGHKDFRMAFHWKFSKMHTATKWTIHLDFIESSKGFSILDGYLVPVESSKDRLLVPGYHETSNTGSEASFALANH
ncbi:hypothetical protein sscle_04g034450 [Sclerotinia sclerotiorum 1980 UF-70]|uniref:Uncharacterized protein n=1 Tax=Sclerotinia sclerotiorum (strain ATCC 18683 / 1980 / Ss-1) TaxID=665079 RepID=A0A1D9Q163_SCLS1|nr:hypothetical protein sscle_04g034450 [Sclerotinia sclerotiorum 1980 UF-70]